MGKMQFRVTFDDTYTEAQVLIVGTSFFGSHAANYDDATVGQIAMLEVGKELLADDGHQLIQRIK